MNRFFWSPLENVSFFYKNLKMAFCQGLVSITWLDSCPSSGTLLVCALSWQVWFRLISSSSGLEFIWSLMIFLILNKLIFYSVGFGLSASMYISFFLSLWSLIVLLSIFICSKVSTSLKQNATLTRPLKISHPLLGFCSPVSCPLWPWTPL